MNESTLNALKELFNNIGQKIGQGAEWGWPILIKQQIVIGYENVIGVLIGLIISILGIIFGRKLWKKAKEENDDYLQTLSLLLYFIPSVLGLMIISLNLPSALEHLINPEYAALMSLKDLVK